MNEYKMYERGCRKSSHIFCKGDFEREQEVALAYQQYYCSNFFCVRA
ncbi:hypothetical protein V7O61_06850 [Methanolobus sp. WCC1]